MRIYAFGSVLSALCILGGSLTQVVVHYIQKVSNHPAALGVVDMVAMFLFLESPR